MENPMNRGIRILSFLFAASQPPVQSWRDSQKTKTRSELNTKFNPFAFGSHWHTEPLRAPPIHATECWLMFGERPIASAMLVSIQCLVSENGSLKIHSRNRSTDGPWHKNGGSCFGADDCYYTLSRFYGCFRIVLQPDLSRRGSDFVLLSPFICGCWYIWVAKIRFLCFCNVICTYFIRKKQNVQ